jgi:hypothetical protein
MGALLRAQTTAPMSQRLRRLVEDYDVIGPQEFVIGRIFNSIASPPGKPWAWTLAYGFHEDRSPTHGYEQALSVGAKACSGGRLYLYALAAAGQAGVERALENLRAEIERDMKLMGCRSVDQLSRDNLRFR